jgi:non-specific serine/threonine protein kinase
MQQILMTPEKYTDRPPAENHLLDALDELVKSIGNHKILVYAWYRASVEKLLGHFKHLNPAVIYGGVTGQGREDNKQKFIRDESCRMVVMQVRAGGVGIDKFQDVCSHVIYAEICPIPGLFQQSVDRLHRTGQKETTNVYLLVPMKTVAVKLRNNLVQKDAAANSVVRDKRTLLADLMGEAGLMGSLD